MKISAKSILPSILLFLVLLHGCGGSDRLFSEIGSGTISSPAIDTGSIEVRSFLARTIPPQVTDLIFSGYDGQGELVYGPVALAKAPLIRLDSVPTSVVTLRILYLEGTTPRFLASLPVQIRVGEVTVVEDPDFVDFESAVTSLEIVPSQLELGVGQIATLVAKGLLADDSSLELTSVVDWSSQNPAVAGVSNDSPDKGTITAVGVGQAQIRAELGSLQAVAVVEVGSPVPVALRISPPPGSAAVTGVGGSLPLTAEAVLSDGQLSDVTSLAAWNSSPTTIATVVLNTGVVQGVQPGGANVVATYEGLSASIPVEIIQAELETVEVTPGTALMHSGLAKQFRAVGRYSDGSEVDLTFACDWSSDAEATAQVDEAGLVRTVGTTGQSAAVTATFQGVEGGTTVRVGAFLYAASSSGGIVCQPLADNGSFTGTQQTYQAATTYQEVKVGPSGNDLLALTASQTLQSFSIDPQDGSLTLEDSESCPITVTAAADPTSLLISPDERFVYVTSRGSTTVQGFSLDPDSRELVSMGSVFTSPTALDTLSFDRSGQLLFALRSNEILRFAVDPSNGTLQELSPSVTGTLVTPSFLQSASNGLLYAVNRGSRTLAVFSVDGTGTVRPIVGSQFTLPTAMNTSQLTRALILADGSFMYGLFNSTSLVTVPLTPETGRPFGSSAGGATPPSVGLGLTQLQNGDFVYTQVNSTALGQTFRRITKGVIGGEGPTSSPQARSLSVTP